jgi:hypothetical protein
MVVGDFHFETARRRGILKPMPADGGKSSVNSYAKRVAIVVASCSMGRLPARISSVVASAAMYCRLLLFCLASAPEKRKFKVVHYLKYPGTN